MILFLFQLCFTISCFLHVAQINKTIDNKGLSLSVSGDNQFIQINRISEVSPAILQVPAFICSLHDTNSPAKPGSFCVR